MELFYPLLGTAQFKNLYKTMNTLSKLDSVEVENVPWTASKAAIDATVKPGVDTSGDIPLHDGFLVASAEQSFLGMMEKDPEYFLKDKLYYACTPCFRYENGVYDELHNPYFMKVEMFKVVDEKEAEFYRAMMVDLAFINFANILNAKEYEYLGTDQTEFGVDIMLNGIEIGSYGINTFMNKTYVCGTAMAEPRFSKARKSIQLSRFGM